MNDVPESLLRAFLDTAHALERRGLVNCSSGNLSRRLDGERILISASRSWLGRLRAEELSVCRLADGALLSGARPSVETAFHAALLRRRPDWNVVLHHQSPAATAATCGTADPESLFVLPEIPFYIDRIARVPYRTPGSPELHAAVEAAGVEAEMLLLENHGQVTGGRDFDEALQRAVFFELNCDILQRDPTVRRLTPEAIAQLRGAGREARFQQSPS